MKIKLLILVIIFGVSLNIWAYPKVYPKKDNCSSSEIKTTLSVKESFRQLEDYAYESRKSSRRRGFKIRLDILRDAVEYELNNKKVDTVYINTNESET